MEWRGDGHCFRETAVEACKRARLIPQIVLRVASSAAFWAW